MFEEEIPWRGVCLKIDAESDTEHVDGVGTIILCNTFAHGA